MNETAPRLDWTQVDQTRRREAMAFSRTRIPGLTELREALKRGDTVLVAYPFDNMPNKDKGTFHSLMASRVTDLRKKGYKPHTRKEPDGIVMWADKA